MNNGSIVCGFNKAVKSLVKKDEKQFLEMNSCPIKVPIKKTTGTAMLNITIGVVYMLLSFGVFILKNVFAGGIDTKKIIKE